LRPCAAACRRFPLSRAIFISWYEIALAVFAEEQKLRIWPWRNQGKSDPLPVPHVFEIRPRKAGRYFRPVRGLHIAAVLVVHTGAAKVIRHDWLHSTLSATKRKNYWYGIALRHHTPFAQHSLLCKAFTNPPSALFSFSSQDSFSCAQL
jgi:hypothetical protein